MDAYGIKVGAPLEGVFADNVILLRHGDVGICALPTRTRLGKCTDRRRLWCLDYGGAGLATHLAGSIRIIVMAAANTAYPGHRTVSFLADYTTAVGR